MTTIGQKFYDTCWWMAQPVTVPAQWVLKSAAYYLGLQEQTIPYSEAAQRLLQQADVWQKDSERYQQAELWDKIKKLLIQSLMPPDFILNLLPPEARPSYTWKKGDRNEYWSFFVQLQLRGGEPPKPNPLLAQACMNFKKEGKSPGLAVDLGCGAGPGTCELLAQGWEVVAVDSSQVVLDTLGQFVKERFQESPLPEGRLKLVCAEMETYQFPKTVRLIYGNSFPYCNPAKFEQLCDRAFAALEEGGRLVGEFLPSQKNPVADELLRLTGAWMTEKEVVKALLDHRGYQKEACEVDKYWFQSGSRTINFMGRKPAS